MLTAKQNKKKTNNKIYYGAVSGDWVLSLLFHLHQFALKHFTVYNENDKSSKNFSGYAAATEVVFLHMHAYKMNMYHSRKQKSVESEKMREKIRIGGTIWFDLLLTPSLNVRKLCAYFVVFCYGICFTITLYGNSMRTLIYYLWILFWSSSSSSLASSSSTSTSHRFIRN